MPIQKRSLAIRNTILLKTLMILIVFSLFMIYDSKNLLTQVTSQTQNNFSGKPVIIVITPQESPPVSPEQNQLSYKINAQSSQNTQNTQWGVSQQLDQHTYTIKVGDDPTMATPQDIFTALNNYRQKHGSGTLSWDENLAGYAQSRAVSFDQADKLDEHVGFQNYLNNEDGFQKLGYGKLGENSSIGYKLIGVHLIEWVYASDQPHNQNQLDPSWNTVGIGVSGTATDLVFASNKL